MLWGLNDIIRTHLFWIPPSLLGLPPLPGDRNGSLHAVLGTSGPARLGLSLTRGGSSVILE